MGLPQPGFYSGRRIIPGEEEPEVSISLRQRLYALAFFGGENDFGEGHKGGPGSCGVALLMHAPALVKLAPEDFFRGPSTGSRRRGIYREGREEKPKSEPRQPLRVLRTFAIHLEHSSSLIALMVPVREWSSKCRPIAARTGGRH